ncbi:hypothetical protein ACUSIJ_27565 [Pseudochelatococcus sp. B33]
MIAITVSIAFPLTGLGVVLFAIIDYLLPPIRLGIADQHAPSRLRL